MQSYVIRRPPTRLAIRATRPGSLGHQLTKQHLTVLNLKTTLKSDHTPKEGKKLKNNRGFSLLELLIVVAIILIIATIAIPSLLRSRQAAQESSAVSNIRTINTAEVTYLSSNGGNYGSIPELITAGLLDSRFATAVSGYTFAVTASASDYTANATPVSANAGRYAYYSLPDAVVRYSSATTGCGGTGGVCYPTGMSDQPVQ